LGYSLQPTEAETVVMKVTDPVEVIDVAEESDEQDDEECDLVSNHGSNQLPSDEQDPEGTCFYDDQEIADLDENEFDLADQQIGSVPDNSVVDAYLARIQDRLRGGKYPEEYKNGTFWVNTKSPSFILKSETDPTALYEPRVFLWFPHHLKKDLKCPTCSSDIKVKSFNNKPRARRIIDLTEYVLIFIENKINLTFYLIVHSIS
jgi:hypothetical protein